jgi:ABC-type lipoprotein export system ATPase subunit
MQIKIDRVFPTYFDDSRRDSSDVWGKDLVFSKGEYIKIVAPSGSGKTSLIHFLYGLRDEYNGTIFYDDHALKTISIEETSRFRKDHVSMVFQDLRLFPEQTVFENIDIKRSLNPYHPVEKIGEMAEKLGIGSKLQLKIKTCSYGEQQRVAIIRALMQPFDFLLLDEPFSHLDNKNSENAMQLMLEEAQSRNASIIFADLERIDYFPFSRLYHL